MNNTSVISKKANISTQDKSGRYWMISIFIFACLLYSNTLKNGFVLDDSLAITLNKTVQRGVEGIPDLVTKSFYYGASGENQNLYRPFTLIVYATEFELFGSHPIYYHLINILLFAFTCVFIFYLLRSHFFKPSVVVPAIAALLFAVHPIHTEVVANIKSIDEILALLGGLVSLHFLLLYIASKKFNQLLAAIVFFAIAIFSKENAITFPGVLPLTIIMFRQEPVKKTVLLIMPFIAVAIIYILMRYSFVDKHFENLSLSQNSLVGATNYMERFATAMLILGKYLKLLIFPHPLVCDYSYNQIPLVSVGNIFAISSILIHLILLGTGFFFIKRNKIISWSIFYYFITTVVVSNIFILIGTPMGERLLYMPSLGFCIFVPAIILYFLKTSDTISFKELPAYFRTTGIIILLLFSIKTFSRNMDWKDNFTLFSKALKDSPNSVRVHFSMANEYLNAGLATSNPVNKTGNINNAISHFKKAIDILPTYKQAWLYLGNAYYNNGDNDNAEKMYIRALELDSTLTSAINFLGVINGMKGNNVAAEKLFERAIRINDHDPDAYANLGNLFLIEHKYDPAADMLAKANTLNPANENVLLNIIDSYKALNNTERMNFYQTKLATLKNTKK